MCRSTIIFAVYDYNSAAVWKGALQLKAMFAELEQRDTAVFMASLSANNLMQAQNLADRLQLPFKLTTIASFKPQLCHQLPLKKHGDNIVLILDSYGTVCDKSVVAYAPHHAIQTAHLLAQTCKINRRCLTDRFNPQNGRLLPTHFFSPA